MSRHRIEVVAPRDQDPLGPEVVAEFDVLLTRLDLKMVTRVEWDRIKTILTIATLEAGDHEKGAEGFATALAKWRTCRLYDGKD